MDCPSSMDDYDGIMFLPHGDDVNAIHFELLELKENMGKEVGGTDVGLMYHVLLFQHNNDETGMNFIENFEAIFANPIVYIKGLVGSKIFGLMLKKKEKTHIFFNRYVKQVKKQLMEFKL